jgi:hypothetical protein
VGDVCGPWTWTAGSARRATNPGVREHERAQELAPSEEGHAEVVPKRDEREGEGLLGTSRFTRDVPYAAGERGRRRGKACVLRSLLVMCQVTSLDMVVIGTGSADHRARDDGDHVHLGVPITALRFPQGTGSAVNNDESHPKFYRFSLPYTLKTEHQ